MGLETVGSPRGCADAWVAAEGGGPGKAGGDAGGHEEHARPGPREIPWLVTTTLFLGSPGIMLGSLGSFFVALLAIVHLARYENSMGPGAPALYQSLATTAALALPCFVGILHGVLEAARARELFRRGVVGVADYVGAKEIERHHGRPRYRVAFALRGTETPLVTSRPPIADAPARTEQVIYDPAHPGDALFTRNLFGAPHVDEHGTVRLRGRHASVILLIGPVMTVYLGGHYLAWILHFW